MIPIESDESMSLEDQAPEFSETDPLQGNAVKWPSPWLVVPSVTLAVLAISMTFAPLQQIVLLIVCDRLDIPGSRHNQTSMDPLVMKHHPLPFGSWLSLPDYEVCAESEKVQQMTSWWSMVLSISSNIPALIATPYIGMLSDQMGRKFGLAMPMVGNVIHIVLVIVVACWKLSLWLLAIGNLVQGLLGSFLVLQASAFAYVADTSPVTTRSSLFGRIEAFIFVAFMLGPFVGGQITRIVRSFHSQT